MIRKSLPTLLLAGAATLSLGIGSALAQDAGGYVYPDFWGNQTAHAAPQARAAAPSNGDAIGTYVTHSSNAGTWLFPPDPNNGG
jgi:hypothetical protein